MADFQSYTELHESILNTLSDDKKKEWNYGIENKYILPLSNGMYLVHMSYYNSFMSDIVKDKKDPYGIENVNFSLVEPDDYRWEEYKQQRLEIGFDNSEIWNLDTTISKFILPRLKAFKEISCGIPGKLVYEFKKKGYSSEKANQLADKEWDKILDKIIWAFENYNEEPYLGAQDFNKIYKEYNDKLNEGLKLFAEWFRSLSY